MNFEEDLKIAQKTSDQQFACWLALIGSALQRRLEYGSDFLRMQQEVYEIVFGGDGVLNRLVRRSLHLQHLGLRDMAAMHQILFQLSPTVGECTLYSALIDTIDTQVVKAHILPCQIQLLLSDSSVAVQNLHFQQFQLLFNENLIKSTRGSELRLNAQLHYWVYLLNAAVNYKENTLKGADITRMVLECMEQKGRRMPKDDMIMVHLTSNPFLVLIRRILYYHAYECINQQAMKVDGKKTNQLLQFSKMVVLLQEYALYQCLYSIQPQLLTLNTEQNRLLHRLKPSSSIRESQLLTLYVLIALNSLFGIRLESLYQQFNRVFVQRQSQIIQQSFTQRSFFFETGRPLQQVTFHKALFSILHHGLEQYLTDKQCQPLSLLTYLGTYVLFLRWQYARHELQLISVAQLFDQAMYQYGMNLERLDKVTNFGQGRSTMSIGYIVNYVVSYLLKILGWQQWSDLRYQRNIISLFIPNVVGIVDYNEHDRKDLNEPFQYHYRELDEFRQGINHQVVYQYPFYTVLLNRILETTSNLARISKDEYQGILNLILYLYSNEPNALFCSLLKLQYQSGISTQLPNYADIKPICESINPNCNADKYQVFQQSKQYPQQVVQLLQSYDLGRDKTKQLIRRRSIEFLQNVFNLPVDFSIILSSRQNTIRVSQTMERSTGRMSLRPKSQTGWVVPIKESEFIIFYHLMLWLSHGLDIILCRQQIEGVPKTTWPRQFAGYGLILLIPMLVFLRWFIGSIM